MDARTVIIVICGIIVLVCLIRMTVDVIISITRKPRKPGPKKKPKYHDEDTPQRRAGEQGEKEATLIIRSALRKEDVLLTNVQISYNGKDTELDNVVINDYGVYIIEVKSYTGQLYGKEEDPEWTKINISQGGNRYEKQVRNPIGQVKRQTYILARYLRQQGIDVWVEGYVYLLHKNSPVESEFILKDSEAIHRAIHGYNQRQLHPGSIRRIVKVLKKD